MTFTIVDSVIILATCAVTTMIFVQVFKTVLNSILIGRLDLKTLLADGDFPSSHTAILISFNIVSLRLAYLYYTNHPELDAFPAVLASCILGLWSFYEIRDAMGVRLRVQEHAHAIKQIVLTSKDMSDMIDKLRLVDNDRNSKALQSAFDDLLSNLKLKAGHMPHEVLGGIVTGGLIGSLFITVLERNFTIVTLIAITFVMYVAATVAIFIRRRKKESKM